MLDHAGTIAELQEIPRNFLTHQTLCGQGLSGTAWIYPTIKADGDEGSYRLRLECV